MSSITRPIRVVYFGTPAYAVPALESIAADLRFDVALVVTQPDRPVGRGRSLQAPAVKIAAESLALPVYQPESLRATDARIPLEDASADLFVVAAYGLIFGAKTLVIPRYGCLNLHASLLPRYRGASPISAAIAEGDERTGVTLMRMDAGMDTGDIVAKREVTIAPDDTTGSLTARLATCGAELAIDAIPRWVDGEITPVPQPQEGASLVRPLVKGDGWLDWSRPAGELERHIRAMQPWPRAWTTLPDRTTLQVLQALVAPHRGQPPGYVDVSDKFVTVATGEGGLRLLRVQPAGGSMMDASSLLQGRRLRHEDRLGEQGRPERLTPMIVPVGDSLD